MLPGIVLDVCLKFRRVLDLDIFGQAKVKAADSGIIIDSGLQNPVGAFPGDVLGGQRVLLQQEVLRPDIEAQLDFLRELTGHTEHISALAAVAAFELPVLIECLNLTNA